MFPVYLKSLLLKRIVTSSMHECFLLHSYHSFRSRGQFQLGPDAELLPWVSGKLPTDNWQQSTFQAEFFLWQASGSRDTISRISILWDLAVLKRIWLRAKEDIRMDLASIGYCSILVLLTVLGKFSIVIYLLWLYDSNTFYLSLYDTVV